jgi:hypothetical protein
MQSLGLVYINFSASLLVNSGDSQATSLQILAEFIQLHPSLFLRILSPIIDRTEASSSQLSFLANK